MKKIILFIIIVVALLPLIGNKLIQSTLDENIKMITSNGIEVKHTQIDSNYLSTSVHYEFMVKDSDKFMIYLNQYADKQIPSYINMMLLGMHVGLDLSYSNILFNNSVEVDIYPLSLAKKTAIDLEKEDKEFYEYITNFLKIKGLLYHINYNVSSENFDGYIKDIDEEYTFKDGTNTQVIMNNMLFTGSGSLTHPNKMDSTLKRIVIKSTDDAGKLDLLVEDVKSSSIFKTKTTYSTQVSVANLDLITEAPEDAKVYLKDLSLAVSSDTQSDKAHFSSHSSFKELIFDMSTSDIELFGFNYSVSLKDIDKKSFEELSRLLPKVQNDSSKELQDKISKLLLDIITKGFTIDLKDMSLDKISKDSKKAVDAFSLKALLNVKQDPKLVNKIKVRTSQIIKNTNFDAYIKISKDFFKMMNKEVPVSMIAGGFAKELKNDYIFDIKFKDSKLNVNGKAIK